MNVDFIKGGKCSMVKLGYDLKDFLYESNFDEFKKLDSFERKIDFYSDYCLDAANHDVQIFIYATHKKKNKYIKIYFLKGVHKRPKSSSEVLDFKHVFEFWDNDFKTEKSKFIRELKKIRYVNFKFDD